MSWAARLVALAGAGLVAIVAAGLAGAPDGYRGATGTNGAAISGEGAPSGAS